MRYAVILEKTKDNWSVSIPDLEGCGSTGTTIAEALTNVREAIILHLAGMVDDGEAIPDPVTVAEYVDVPPPMPSAQTSGVIVLPANEEIKAIRAANGLTQQELAKAAGVRQETISRIESGRNRVTPKMLRRIKGSVSRRPRAKAHA
ncbi:MAG: type II toxin-antitoxin system HicB family antitoxin [Phycisphaerales bacterium]|nr:type II toxin-antitoxin system HicB family antitoxin [Phycisphaerales bacterium]